MSITISAMMEGNYVTSGQKAKNRRTRPRPSRYMDVRTAAAVSIRQSASINIMPKKMLTGIKS